MTIYSSVARPLRFPSSRGRMGDPAQLLHGDGASRGAPLEVVLVDTRSVVRKGIALVISREPDMELLFEVGSADEAIEAVASLGRLSRVVVVVSLTLGGERDSLWLIRTVRERFPSVRILASGSNGEAATVSRALLTGADGYVDKGSEADGFLDALRRA